jgi:multisubunit Na+/H+ antiporter MnhG subunit
MHLAYCMLHAACMLIGMLMIDPTSMHACMRACVHEMERKNKHQTASSHGDEDEDKRMQSTPFQSKIVEE